jgi:hypothetical protein
MENIEDPCSKCGCDRNINGVVKRRRICKKCANEESRLYKLNKKNIKKFMKLHNEENVILL